MFSLLSLSLPISLPFIFHSLSSLIYSSSHWFLSPSPLPASTPLHSACFLRFSTKTITTHSFSSWHCPFGHPPSGRTWAMRDFLFLPSYDVINPPLIPSFFQTYNLAHLVKTPGCLTSINFEFYSLRGDFVVGKIFLYKQALLHS